MLRPADDAGQAGRLAAAGAWPGVEGAVAAAASAAAATTTLPGLALPAAASATPAMIVTGGLVVDAPALVRGVWAAAAAAAAARGAAATLVPRLVPDLAELTPLYDGIVLTAGAAAAAVVGGGGDGLRCALSRGFTATLDPGPCPPPAALLGATYAAPRPGGGVVVGATREACADAASALGDAAARGAAGDVGARDAAAAELQARLTLLYPPAAAWPVAGVRRGVRALPPRSGAGRPPLAGCTDAAANAWIIGGLGARGLLYAGWLGREVAAGVCAGGGGDGGLDPELTRWRRFRHP